MAGSNQPEVFLQYGAIDCTLGICDRLAFRSCMSSQYQAIKCEGPLPRSTVGGAVDRILKVFVLHVGLFIDGQLNRSAVSCSYHNTLILLRLWRVRRDEPSTHGDLAEGCRPLDRQSKPLEVADDVTSVAVTG